MQTLDLEQIAVKALSEGERRSLQIKGLERLSEVKRRVRDNQLSGEKTKRNYLYFHLLSTIVLIKSFKFMCWII